jgi:hypothetical protein
MVWVDKWRASWAFSLLGLATAFIGCSGESSSNSCIAYCDNLCSSLTTCELSIGEEDCQEACQSGLTDAECRNQPAPDRLTCDELTEVVTCAEYCGTLCERAPKCGTFDAKACVTGCASSSPSICNAASVAARTCDQLKPEIRLYERRGTPSDGDSASGGFLSPSSFGLCEEAEDCEAPLGCSQATNTCAACETNDDCAHDYGAYICNDAQECEKVACVADKDCILDRPCNTETHECGECRKDADCTLSFRPVCDTKTLKCIE